MELQSVFYGVTISLLWSYISFYGIIIFFRTALLFHGITFAWLNSVMPFWIFIGMTLSPFIDGYFRVTSSDLTVCWIPIISESYGTQVQGL